MKTKNLVLFYNGVRAMFGEPGSGQYHETMIVKPGHSVWLDRCPGGPRPFLDDGKTITFATEESRIAAQLAQDIGADICQTRRQFDCAIYAMQALAA